MEIKRRDFLKLLGGISGAVAFSAYGCNQIIDIPERLIEMAKKGAGIESWKNTICGQCPGGCGISVRLIDGIPVYIKGNPIYPVNQGGMCPSGHSALEVLYNPDRIKEPMKRIGLPGSGKWESISWDEALQIISDYMIKQRENNKSHQVVFIDGSEQNSLMKEHISHFMKAYGSPNYYQYPSVKNSSVPFQLLQGIEQIPSYDFFNTKYILSFGSNFLEEGYSPIYYSKMYAHLREETEARRARFIQIDSRMSLTAANADRWMPIRPGTYGALALGVAYVLIREELYDKQFVNKYTFGFEDWTDKNGQTHLGFKSNVLGNYYPEQVSEITGVQSETILEIARELGINKPSLVLGDQGSADNTNSTFSQMAVYSLNALLGNFNNESGLSFTDQPPLAELPEVKVDKLATIGNKQPPIGLSQNSAFPFTNFSVDSFIENVLADDPYPVSALFLYKGNPLFNALNHHDFAEALKKIPLVVSFDSFLTETSEYADIILPDHTFLEKWDEISNIPSVGFTHVGIQQPVIEPLFNTRNSAEVLVDLGNLIGESVSNALPFENYEQEIKFRVEKIYRSGKGAIISEGLKGSWLEFLHQRGWQEGEYNSFNEFWELLTRNGGWWNPIKQKKYIKNLFKTPSGKFEFYSQLLKKKIDQIVLSRGEDTPQNRELLINSLNISARGDKIFLPHHEEVPVDEGIPLYLTTYKLLTNRNGQSSNQPMMQEMFGYTNRKYWSSWGEIHPKTAAQNGISDGDWMWIESSVGNIKVQAKVHPCVMRDVVAVPFGLGHTSYGRFAKGYGINPYSIVKNKYDVINGNSAPQATRVKISRAT
ncbi:MAG: molybdopterin-dependent oxidoreductase [Bacteroidetes bacterium]|nr:molybdopterin-dependent oxidoreductase [Bacteroidota bacterium]